MGSDQSSASRGFYRYTRGPEAQDVHDVLDEVYIVRRAMKFEYDKAQAALSFQVGRGPEDFLKISLGTGTSCLFFRHTIIIS